MNGRLCMTLPSLSAGDPVRASAGAPLEADREVFGPPYSDSRRFRNIIQASITCLTRVPCSGGSKLRASWSDPSVTRDTIIPYDSLSAATYTATAATTANCIFKKQISTALLKESYVSARLTSVFANHPTRPARSAFAHALPVPRGVSIPGRRFSQGGKTQGFDRANDAWCANICRAWAAH